LLAQQLVDLGRHEIAVFLSENGESRFPFQAKTFPPLNFTVGKRVKLIARARERFTTLRNIVEMQLHQWLANTSSNFDPPRRKAKKHHPGDDFES